LKGDMAELDLERQLHNYQQVLAVLQASDEGGEAEEDYDDLRHVQEAVLAVGDALRETGNNRLVIVEGPSGCGKTSIARCLVAKWPAVTRLAEADETWSESLAECLAGLLQAVGPIERRTEEAGARAAVGLPHTCGDRKRKLFEALQARRLILIIDEAHHLGVRALNEVKALLNQTPTVVVLLAIPTLLRRLESQAYEEARQLTKNRLSERVHVAGPEAGEVGKYLGRRGVRFTEAGVAKQAAAKLAHDSAMYGHWNFVNLVARKARSVCGKDEAIDLEGFCSALVEVARTR
jgi:type II secretory pathway predicted ATPase ExeA